MDQRKLVTLAILGALLGLGLWTWSSRHTSATAQVDTDRPDGGPQPPAAVTPAPSRATQGASSPLPPAGTALAGIFAPLKQRADQGDALAACRLAVELIECRDANILAMYMTEDPDHENSAETADHLDRMHLRQLGLAQHCEGIDATQSALAGKYLAMAAKAGINEAMIRYADGQGFNQSNQLFGILQDPGFDAWRRDAPNLLQRALRQGEPGAALLLMIAYTDDNSQLAGLIPNDPVQYFSYRLLIERLRGRNQVPKNDLPPQQLAQARQHAERMHRDYFGSRVMTQPNAFRRALSRSWLWPEAESPRNPCE